MTDAWHFKLSRYEVVLRFRYPAWDEKQGIPFEVEARTKAEAIQLARKEAFDGGHWPCRDKGRATFTATRLD